MPGPINFRRNVAALDDITIKALYRECTPRVLVVTDNLNFSSGSGFGLSQFVSSLRSATVHGMTPVVTTASRYASPGADLTAYDFNDSGNGLLKTRYDVLFLLGIDSEGAGDLPPAQVDTIARFMQAGGGVFATGDHQTLGAALSGNLPRVNAMRKWKAADMPPDVASTTRHSTNNSGGDETEEFDDQSDARPQRLYVNYRTVAGGTAAIDRLAHPVLQMVATRRVIEVFPDHPHEGECRVPASLAGAFKLDGDDHPLWPKDAAGGAVAPEIAAYSVSSGDGFTSGPTGPKLGVTPRLFGAIAAYDGHRAGRGRVVTDATWHHFVNINLDGTGSPLSGLLGPGGVDSEELLRMRRYYVNLATWLMPSSVRQCLRYPLMVKALQRYPLFEELELPRPPELAGTVARETGRQLIAALARFEPAFVANALADDALDEALGAERAAALRQQPGEKLASLSLPELSQAALGGQLVMLAQELEALKSPQDIQPHKSFEGGSVEGARMGVQRLLDDRRADLRKLDELIGSLCGDLGAKR